jgi:hypothetical protein
MGDQAIRPQASGPIGLKVEADALKDESTTDEINGTPMKRLVAVARKG